MLSNRLFHPVMIIILAVMTACTPQVAATPDATSVAVAISAQEQPVTLRLAVADEEGRPSDPYVHEFIDQVKTISHGNITVEPPGMPVAPRKPASRRV
jgi:hypothetical protein